MTTKFYAVKNGRDIGIFNSWAECKKSAIGFPNAKYKSFTSMEEAKAYIKAKVPTSSTRPKSQPKPPKKDRKPTEQDLDVARSDGIRRVYTDGSCIDSVGGYAYLDTLTGEECYGHGDDDTTNQKMELLAIKTALENIDGDLVIMTDSKYCIDCLSQWWPKWIKNGWKTANGGDVENQELISEALQLMKGRSITFSHVYGHSGDILNERVDFLADLGREIEK